MIGKDEKRVCTTVFFSRIRGKRGLGGWTDGRMKRVKRMNEDE